MIREIKKRHRNGRIAKTHGRSKCPEYMAWIDMRRRVFNRGHKYYKDYGGRGITVCKRWLSFETFFKDMGSRPSKKHSLDRIKNEGNYHPRNCRWATRLEQAANTRTCFLITRNGVTKSLKQWAKLLGVNYQTAKWRKRHGFSDDEVLTTNKLKKRRG